MSPGRVDVAVVQRHLAALDEVIQHLSRHRGTSAAELETNQDAAWVIERGLQLACQDVLDLATHLVARSGRSASDYTEALDQLAQLGILPHPFARGFRSVAGLRNALVHGDLRLDKTALANVLDGGLEDFRLFAAHVRAAVELG